MRVVSENSEGDLRRLRALEAVGRALRALTANLLRVTRGAGRPEDVGRQTAGLLAAMEQHREAAGYYPSADDVSAALSLREPFRSDLPPEYREQRYAEQSMVAGALQVAASKLLGQRTQETAGLHELYTGLNAIQAQRREEHAKAIEADKARRAQERARKPARKTAAKRKPARVKRPEKPEA